MLVASPTHFLLPLLTAIVVAASPVSAHSTEEELAAIARLLCCRGCR